MPLFDFNQGSVVCDRGEPLQHISFVTKGFVEAAFRGHTFRFEPGDAIGLCALSTGKHSFTYTAISDVTIASYPYENFHSITPFFSEKADMGNRLVSSLSRQISNFLKYRSALKKEADSARELIEKAYPEYERLCELYAFSSKKLAGLSEFVMPFDSDPVKEWIHNYYTEINNLDAKVQKEFFYGNAGISSGYFFKGADDIFLVLESCKLYQEYLKEVSEIFLNKEGHDMFAIVSELHLNSVNIRGADSAVGAVMEQLVNLLGRMTYVDQAYFRERLTSYKNELSSQRTTEGGPSSAPSPSALKQNLSNSLNVILEYSGCPDELCNMFARLLQEYARIPDRSNSDDAVYNLRKKLTELFNTIYRHVLIRSMHEDKALPTVIKMFLNFGYVDADLAGHKNADYLYSIADSLKGDPAKNIFTLPEWLTAIYKGQKEPSRNDFDTDYPGHLREMRHMRKIDEKEEARLLTDLGAKLNFELENVFPIVNKITFGRITAFCPVFSDHNVQRDLEVALVTPASLEAAFNEVRSIDFTAYYREVLYTNPESGISKEFIHVEVMPEIILMPNVGIRGSMWQEMEGRKHSTPARIFMPMFFLNDLKALIMRLTGELRWELCKRIQGPRWSDFSYPSLTSEFFDYMQFYKTNRELSAEVKSSIKTELVRARNNFKEVFVSNYVDWLVYESKGSSRLNKIARKVLLDYCPFPAEIREKLAMNPQFSDLFKRYNFKIQQRVRMLQNVIQKAEKAGAKAPQELLDEIKYVES